MRIGKARDLAMSKAHIRISAISWTTKHIYVVATKYLFFLTKGMSYKNLPKGVLFNLS